MTITVDFLNTNGAIILHFYQYFFKILINIFPKTNGTIIVDFGYFSQGLLKLRFYKKLRNNF